MAPPINANVTNQQIAASVGESKIDVTVSGGVGPTGPSGSAALPSGTEGYVLTYVSGSWVAAAPSGGVTSWNELEDVPATFPPDAHAASHAPNGADELYDQALNTTDAVTFQVLTVMGDAYLGAGGNVTISEEGDISCLGLTVGGGYQVIFDGVALSLVDATVTGLSYDSLEDLPTLGTAAAEDTTAFASATHNHAWSDITSGVPTTLSGYGITDAVASNDSRLTDARTPTAHSHGNITDAGAIGTTSGLVVTTTASGVLNALSQGTAGQVLKVNSGATGVEWGAAAADVSIDTTAADILSASSGSITADDPGADRLVFWDDSAGKLTHLTVGTGLTIAGTTITSAGSTSASGLTSGTLGFQRLPSRVRASTNLYLWSSFR